MRDKVLVTGATGFTGSHLCRRLIEEGYQVRAFIRSQRNMNDLIGKGIEIVTGDLRNYSDVKKAVDEVDIVYHIAAAYRQEGIAPREFSDTNVLGTKHMVDASISSGVKRFIHCSTVGVHGDIKNPPASEDAPFSTGDLYQETKLEAEKLICKKIEEGKIQGVVFRPSGIYGPGDMRFLKLFRAIARGRFVMIGKGNVYYHMTYIDDLVDGILLCGTRQEALGNIFILAGPTYTTLDEMVKTIADVSAVSLPNWHLPVKPVYWAGWLCEIMCKPLGLEPPLYRRRVDFFTKSRAFSINKASQILGYQPKINLEEGIRRTAEWYRQENLI